MSGKINATFDQIASAMIVAANRRNVADVEQALNQSGFTQLGDGTSSQKTIWEKHEDAERHCGFNGVGMINRKHSQSSLT
ncbi:hypothetical protein [Bradyrhizobium sp. CB1015]|uniref:hypothetical protein n=1 Tax=Bradyrhizobium sp. CB1015 TaxID=2976822 RepID=UPI0021A9AF87|nr:hypothetical protein [Bradyrhizobium sp. CB1015]UWU89604.1 hypothetical protein N2604_24240 [Bradyrhizobium sp. CB1015]